MVSIDETRFRQRYPELSRRQLVSKAQDEIIARLPPEHFRQLVRYQATFGFALEVDDTTRRILNRDLDIRQVNVPRPLRPFLTEGVPLIRANEVQNLGYQGENSLIAVIDSGIDYTQPYLKGNMWINPGEIPANGLDDDGNGFSDDVNGYDFGDNDGDPMDCCRHGTAVAGIIASNHPIYRGVAPQARILALKLFRNDGTGDTGALERALDYLLVNHQRLHTTVVNLSIGEENAVYDSHDDPACIQGNIPAQIHELTRQGVTVVAASGNAAEVTGIAFPACIADVISVGAVYDASFPYTIRYGEAGCEDKNPGLNQICCYSNTQQILDLLAPSYCATTLDLGNQVYPCFAGTSAACPYVAGAIALLQQGNDFSLTKNQILGLLKEYGLKVLDPRIHMEFSRIDVMASLQNSAAYLCNNFQNENIAGPLSPFSLAGNFFALNKSTPADPDGLANLLLSYQGQYLDHNQSLARASLLSGPDTTQIFEILLGNLNDQVHGDVVQVRVNQAALAPDKPITTPLVIGSSVASLNFYPDGSFFIKDRQPISAIAGQLRYSCAETALTGRQAGNLIAFLPSRAMIDIAEETVEANHLQGHIEAITARIGSEAGEGNAKALARLDESGTWNMNGDSVNNLKFWSKSELQENVLQITIGSRDANQPLLLIRLARSGLIGLQEISLDNQAAMVLGYARQSDYASGLAPIWRGCSGILRLLDSPFQGEPDERMAIDITAIIGPFADCDRDGRPDDGNDIGEMAGDNPCRNGQSVDCDDNCPNLANPDQADSDADGIGDLCDPFVGSESDESGSAASSQRSEDFGSSGSPGSSSDGSSGTTAPTGGASESSDPGSSNSSSDSASSSPSVSAQTSGLAGSEPTMAGTSSTSPDTTGSGSEQRSCTTGEECQNSSCEKPSDCLDGKTCLEHRCVSSQPQPTENDPNKNGCGGCAFDGHRSLPPDQILLPGLIGLILAIPLIRRQRQVRP
jgi:subtilisin family serine protease